MSEKSEKAKESKAVEKELKKAEEKKVEGKKVEKEKEEKKKKPVEKEKKVTKKRLPEEVHTINLGSTSGKPSVKRKRAAIAAIKDYVYKHKRKEAKISPELNNALSNQRRIRVKLVIGDTVTVYPVK